LSYVKLSVTNQFQLLNCYSTKQGVVHHKFVNKSEQNNDTNFDKTCDFLIHAKRVLLKPMVMLQRSALFVLILLTLVPLFFI